MSSTTERVWLITGCSTGLGREIASLALQRGQRVVLTARDPQQVRELQAAYPAHSIAVALDVTAAGQIAAAVAAAERAFGRIDVLVNNAGYGYLAAIEEGEEAEVRAMFETNFFGLLALTRAVLPGMRARRSGHIINMSSMAGLVSNPGTGYYSTTKYAVEALSEALAKEVKPFGIRVTAVEPGPFRTDWAGRSLKQARTAIDDYADHVGARRRMIAEFDGRQPGDPQRAAAAIVELADCAEPPLNLLLGRQVLEVYRAKLLALQQSLDQWEQVTVGADFPES
jgi:NAD(P)-dependent dehydrogenase (short-subunit alcohol dehydrogenase family)